jgi:hypothetical protein
LVTSSVLPSRVMVMAELDLFSEVLISELSVDSGMVWQAERMQIKDKTAVR